VAILNREGSLQKQIEAARCNESSSSPVKAIVPYPPGKL